MRPILSFILTIAVAVSALTVPGCSPTVVCRVETIVAPDYTVRRITRLDGYPNPRFPNQRPRLAEYFNFPPAELYDSYSVQQDRVLFAGTFDSYEKIPNDLVRVTPGAELRAGNIFSYRVMDFVFFVLADFDETITDIVRSRSDGEAALDELLRLVVPEVMSVLHARYGARYDLSRLESWLSNDLPQKLRRLYAGAWVIHSTRRSGVTSPGEDFELYMFLVSEAKREGLELAPLGTPDLYGENVRRLKEYAIRLAESLCPPRQAGGGSVGQEMMGGAVLEELLAAVQKAVVVRHGSINNYLGKISSLVPRAFGAYLTSTVMPLYMLPETTYQCRLRAPGRILQTNGVVDLNGDLVWTFVDRDLAFTGQSMWARTVFVREPITYSLGLRGFPATLSDVDAFYGLCVLPDDSPRESVLKALQQSAATRSFAPLKALADSASPDSESARGLFTLFNNHRQRSAPAPSSTETGTESRAQQSSQAVPPGAPIESAVPFEAVQPAPQTMVNAPAPIPEPAPSRVGTRQSGDAETSVPPQPSAPSSAMPAPAAVTPRESPGSLEPPPLPPPVR